ncbi:hypothetical protein B296_00056386, partial [Ensete ventricosum]
LYNRKVQSQQVSDNDLVLRKAKVSVPGHTRGKLAPNWEGPYRVIRTVQDSTYILDTNGWQNIAQDAAHLEPKEVLCLKYKIGVAWATKGTQFKSTSIQRRMKKVVCIDLRFYMIIGQPNIGRKVAQQVKAKYSQSSRGTLSSKGWEDSICSLASSSRLVSSVPSDAICSKYLTEVGP